MKEAALVVGGELVPWSSNCQWSEMWNHVTIWQAELWKPLSEVCFKSNRELYLSRWDAVCIHPKQPSGGDYLAVSHSNAPSSKLSAVRGLRIFLAMRSEVWKIMRAQGCWRAVFLFWLSGYSQMPRANVSLRNTASQISQWSQGFQTVNAFAVIVKPHVADVCLSGLVPWWQGLHSFKLDLWSHMRERIWEKQLLKVHCWFTPYGFQWFSVFLNSS